MIDDSPNLPMTNRPIQLEVPRPTSETQCSGNSGEQPESKRGEVCSPIDAIAKQALEAQIVEVIRTCYDPEIPVNIYELGLIYGIEIDDANAVHVRMTLTSPACPVAGSLPIHVEARLRAIDGVSKATVEVVWDPPWTPERMSEAARLQLNL